MQEERKTPRDGLDEYIRVSSPGLLIIIGALSLVLVATVVWGFTGTLPVTLTVTGCVVDPEISPEAQVAAGDATANNTKEPQDALVLCFVDSSKFSAEQISDFHQDVTVVMPDRTTFKGKIEGITPQPLSKDEGQQILVDSKWVAEQCMPNDYSWGVVVHVEDDISGHLFTTPEVTITTEEVPPIRFLTR